MFSFLLSLSHLVQSAKINTQMGVSVCQCLYTYMIHPQNHLPDIDLTFMSIE
jgi:hypothetical protein